MNAKHAESNRVFRDLPVAGFSTAPARRSSLHDDCREQPDLIDALLRAFLVLCMIVTLVICAWHIGDWQNTRYTARQPSLAVKSCPVDRPHVL